MSAFYTVNLLPIISAIISRAVISRGWTANQLNGSNCQEVQLMMLGNNLYISGNQNEHDAINTFLRMYGVTDINSFNKCMSYTYWVIASLWAEQIEEFGFHFNIGWGGSETDVVNNFQPSIKLGLTAPEMENAKNIINNTPLNNHVWTAEERRLGWFLNRLLRPNNTTYQAPNLGGSLIVNRVDPNTSDRVYIIKNEGMNQVHAELNLLCALGDALVESSGLFSGRDVGIGGLKKACAHCNSWIEKFSRLLYIQWKIRVVLPAPDGRPRGGGAGYRPNSAKIRNTDNQNTYAGLLFNGQINNNVNDVTNHEIDDVWLE
jgi:hypothetical protein